MSARPGETCEALVRICRHISVTAGYAKHAHLPAVPRIESQVTPWLHVHRPDGA